MKTQLRNIVILGAFFVLAVVNVPAQSRGEVKIPFDFFAGSQQMKAGAYVVKRMSGNALAIRSSDGKTTALVNAPLTIGSRDSKAGQRLVFNNYGDQFYLSQIWLRVDTGRQLFPSGKEIRAAREYKLANGAAKPEQRDVAVVNVVRTLRRVANDQGRPAAQCRWCEKNINRPRINADNTDQNERLSNVSV